MLTITAALLAVMASRMGRVIASWDASGAGEADGEPACEPSEPESDPVIAAAADAILAARCPPFLVRGGEGKMASTVKSAFCGGWAPSNHV